MRRCAVSIARRRRLASAISAGTTSPTNASTRCRTRATASTASSARKMRRNNAAAFWAVVTAVTAADVLTKWWAETVLRPQGFPRGVAGEWLRLTLVYNPGAAFGLNVGEHSRWVFMALTVIALAILGRLYLNTRDGDMPRSIALALVCAGALGNLIDRV